MDLTTSTPSGQPEPPARGTLRFPTMVHFIMASVVLAPLALLPYLPIRARLVRLSRQVEGCNHALAGLRRQVVDMSHAEDVIRLRAEVDALKRETTAAQQQVAAAGGDLAAARDAMAALTAQNEAALRELTELRARADIPSEVLGGMGDGFAAVANFMEETELTLGLNARAGWDMDPRGVSAMRQTALRLRGLRAATSTSSPWPATEDN